MSCVRRYLFRLYPTPPQDAMLHKHRMMPADLWNALKQRCEDVYRRTRSERQRFERWQSPEGDVRAFTPRVEDWPKGGIDLRGSVMDAPSAKELRALGWKRLEKVTCAPSVHSEGKRSLTFFDMTNEITELRRECPEWQAVPAVTLHRVAKQLTLAFEAFYRRCASGEAPGYPRWRARARNTSIPLGTGTRKDKKTGKPVWKTGWRFLQSDDSPFSWSFYYGGADLKDRTTWISARGKFPTPFAPLDPAVLRSSNNISKRIARAQRHRVEEFNNADIIFRDGKWWLSLCIDQSADRQPGVDKLTVRLDALDCFAIVNDVPNFPLGLDEAQELMEAADALKSERDKKWPRPPRRDAGDRGEYERAAEAVSRVSARAARIRSNALHVWTARIISRAQDITLIVPKSIREVTASARGDENDWGANVEDVAKLNRNTLNMAPAMARAMLEYKAAEAGIRCDVVVDQAPKVGVGADLVYAGKELRRAQRNIRKVRNDDSNEGGSARSRVHLPPRDRAGDNPPEPGDDVRT
jgi:hypothetical protein